jgi:hypothetical protein
VSEVPEIIGLVHQGDGEPILGHRRYETFVGHDNPELTEAVRKLLVDHYRDNAEIEVAEEKNAHGKVVLMVRDVKTHDTGWRKYAPPAPEAPVC